MNRTKDRAQGRRTFRLECLEERNLLSHTPILARVLVPPTHPALPTVSVIKGNLHQNRASAPMFAQAILNIWNGTSVSSLFETETLVPIYEGMYSR